MEVKELDSPAVPTQTASSRKTKAWEMKPGEIGLLVDGDYVGEPVLRTYSNLTLLHNPRVTWSHPGDFLVRKLTPGTILTIIAK